MILMNPDDEWAQMDIPRFTQETPVGLIGSKGLVPVNYHGPAEVDQLSHGKPFINPIEVDHV
jgi:hypothetical protein